MSVSGIGGVRGPVTQRDVESSPKGAVKEGAPSAGGRPARGAGKPAAAAAGGGSATFDPKDLNQDGTVSPMEELVYDYSHLRTSASTPYGALQVQQGTGVKQSGLGSMVDALM